MSRAVNTGWVEGMATDVSQSTVQEWEPLGQGLGGPSRAK